MKRYKLCYDRWDAPTIAVVVGKNRAIAEALRISTQTDRVVMITADDDNPFHDEAVHWRRAVTPNDPHEKDISWYEMAAEIEFADHLYLHVMDMLATYDKAVQSLRRAKADMIRLDAAMANALFNHEVEIARAFADDFDIFLGADDAIPMAAD